VKYIQSKSWLLVHRDKPICALLQTNIHNGLQPNWSDVQVVLWQHLGNKKFSLKLKQSLRKFLQQTSAVGEGNILCCLTV